MEDDGLLRVVWPPDDRRSPPELLPRDFRYRRLAQRPPSLDTTPLELGDPGPLDLAEVTAVREELKARGARDQEVRTGFDGRPTPEQIDAMAEKVRANVWPEILDDIGADWGQGVLNQVFTN